MSDIIGLKVRARQIRNATLEGENTAVRVGSLFEDIIDCLNGSSGGDSGDSISVRSFLNTGVKIAEFTKGTSITSIYAPTTGGSGGGGGGGSAYDDTDLWEALNALDNTLKGTTKLANDEKARLDDLVKGIGEDISGRMKDALDFAAWIQGNFPLGEVTFRSGWDAKAQQFLQTVGLWDTDAETTQTMWSNYRQSYNDIMMTVSAVTESEDFTTFLLSKIAQGISEGTISINLDTVYANKDEVDDVITWLYSGLKNQSSADKTFNQLVSAARNGDSTGITELRTLILLLHDGKIVATTNLAAKVDDAISELYQQATADTARTTIFSTVKLNSEDIAAIVVEATGDHSSSTIATKFREWKAGLVTTANKSESIASLLAASSDNTAAAAIAAIVNSNGSTAKISADHIQFTGQTLNAVVSGGLAINNGKQGGMGQYSYLITANDNDGLVIDSRGGNADISIFNIDKYGNISHTYNNVTRFEFNREGDGFIACGNIAWTADGDVVIKSSKEFVDEIGTSVIDEITLEFDETYGFTIKQGDGESVSNRFAVTPSGKLIQMANGVTTFQIEADGSGWLGKPYGNRATTYTPITWTSTSVSLLGTITTTYNASNLRSTSVNGELLCSGSFEVNSGKAILDSDGSGQLANGAIVWDTDGTLTVDGYEAFSLPDSTNLDGFLFHSGSLTAYTIKNGLIVRIPS